MRLFIISDLHREILRPEAKPPYWALPATPAWPVDGVVLAGDIDRGTAGVTWAGQEAGRLGRPVLYVPGNHEYYRQDHDALRVALRAEAARWPDLHLLDNDGVVIQGVRFLGTTLWTDYRVWPQDVRRNQEAARQGLNDHHLIARGGRLFTPQDALALHETARRFLETELARPFAGPTVVITHHGPSRLCRHPDYSDSPLSAAFYSDLSALIRAYASALWVFGHTHAPLDTQIGATRLYSNPVGYPSETLPYPPGFDARGIVTV